MINALPEALEVWVNPKAMLAEWSVSPSKANHEALVAEWVGRAGAVADLGCGPARYADVLDCTYQGFDSSVAMASAARERGHNVSVADIFSFSPGQSYNVVLLIDVAYHQEDPVSAVLRVLELWDASRYLFTLLVGNAHERLLNSVVVSFMETVPLFQRCRVRRLWIEHPSKAEPFAWVLVEATR